MIKKMQGETEKKDRQKKGSRISYIRFDEKSSRGRNDVEKQ